MTAPWPVVTISVRAAFFHTNGVIHDDLSGKPVPRPRRAPELLAGLRVERGDRRLLFVVLQQVDAALVHGRRRRRCRSRGRSLSAPTASSTAACRRASRRTGRRSAERRVEPLAVGDRRFRRVGVLAVPAAERLRRDRFALPLDLAGLRVERVDHVADLVGFRGQLVVARLRALRDLLVGQPLRRHLGDVLVAVEAGRRLLERPRADRRGHEHRVAPHDRRRPAVPGNRHRPLDVLLRRPSIRDPAPSAATPLISWPRNPGHVSAGFGSRALRAATATNDKATATDRLMAHGSWLMASENDGGTEQYGGADLVRYCRIRA